MALTAEDGDGCVGDTFLEVNFAVDVAGGATRVLDLAIRAARGDAEAGGVERGLRRESTEHVQQHLHMALRLLGHA